MTLAAKAVRIKSWKALTHWTNLATGLVGFTTGTVVVARWWLWWGP